ncbi:MAG: hypothetical protein RR256_01630 [Bacteroidales bacterium]
MAEVYLASAKYEKLIKEPIVKTNSICDFVSFLIQRKIRVDFKSALIFNFIV